MTLDPARLAQRRRPFDRLEATVVRLYLANPDDEDAVPVMEALRYVLSFARLTVVRDADGHEVDVGGHLGAHATAVREALAARLEGATTLWAAAPALPDLLSRTRRSRASLLAHLPLDRDSLEEEVTTRKLVLACGGGGGAGYVYPGAYELIERAGLVPDLMVGTSIGALMAMFRCRRRRYDFAPLVAAARTLTWSGVFQVLDTANKYGLPATLRLRLRAALGSLFRHPEGRPLWLSDMEIPLHIVATGFTVDALKHDLGFYEHLLDEEVGGLRGGVRGALKAIQVLREFLGRRDALVEVVLGRAAGTEDFDVLDAAGFSAAIPGVIHYDVLRDDPRMHHVLDQLYADYGITRLGEGGMVANVPARIGWESVAEGRLGRRNALVIGLDCFAPNPRRLAWYPLQQLIRTANVDTDRDYADLMVSFPRTLSPMNLVPPVRDALLAIRWGREAMAPEMPFVTAMMRPIRVLRDE